jgi:hypothetical protein
MLLLIFVTPLLHSIELLSMNATDSGRKNILLDTSDDLVSVLVDDLLLIGVCLSSIVSLLNYDIDGLSLTI